MNNTAVDTEGAWFEPDRISELRRRLPIPYVDIVPVRTDTDGTISQVGLLLRASGTGRIVRAIVSGRVLVHETLREAIARNVEKDLGPIALPRIPVAPQPFTVAEYFPTPGQSLFTDPRQHAISLAYIVPVDGETAPQEDALDLAWCSVTELLASGMLEEMEGGHDIIVRRALAHGGLI
ncbi:NUDIX hydrolase family protein [Brachybacterium muris]|uniref:NUDIX hydrolase family protein n=1 Tax=Brachybacterium muris TaxID=219301 RepID=UPI0021A6DEDB|nr:NUDIX hydrolase family protein [Brachybacterium muris]MCT1430893.1 NUDIX hydrolase family protein [Brachybacterium muris]